MTSCSTSAQKSLKRLLSLDGLIIVLMDLLLLLPCWLSLQLLEAYTLKILAIFSSLNFNNNMIIANPALQEVNLALLRQVGIYSVTIGLLISVLFALTLGPLNYVQWTRIAQKKISWAEGLRFMVIDAGYHFTWILALALLIFVLLEPSKFIFTLPLLSLAYTHLSLGLHIGLVSRHRHQNWKQSIVHAFTPSFHQGWAWLGTYMLGAAVFVITMLLTGLLISVGAPSLPALITLSLIALAWWRMMAWEIMSGQVKQIR